MKIIWIGIGDEIIRQGDNTKEWNFKKMKLDQFSQNKFCVDKKLSKEILI